MAGVKAGRLAAVTGALVVALAGGGAAAAAQSSSSSASLTARVLGVQLSVESARDQQGILVTVVTPGSVAQKLGILY